MNEHKEKKTLTVEQQKEAIQKGFSLADNAAEVKLPNDFMTQLYFAGLGGVGIYILYRLMEKSK